MIVIGITGGIGSGKSFISKLFEIMGVPVYNADERAKVITQTNNEIKTALISLVGEMCYSNDVLNKRILADFIFSSEENRIKVNRIIHPFVFEDFKEWGLTQKTDIIAMECAILFESGFDKVVDSVVSVFAPLKVRIERTMKRDQTTKDLVLARINSQMDEDEKKAKADFIIQNDDTKELIPQVTALIDELRKQNKLNNL